jgi:hypothetical protein
MKTYDDATALAVDLLHDRNFAPSTLLVLKEIIDRKETHLLINKLVKRENGESDNIRLAVSKAMAILELLGRIDNFVSCILMSDLFEQANDLYLNHICESIDIWISKNSTPELKRQLKLKMPSHLSDSMRKHYEEWVRD